MKKEEEQKAEKKANEEAAQKNVDESMWGQLDAFR